jgi:SAM-dependent methyltransferase
MSFSREWDERYQENTHMSIWPWSDLVSLVMRHKPQEENFKVLELGCGAGANIPLFASLGANYYAVEGSKTIVKKLHQQYPQFKGNIVSGDFTKDIPDEKFDLIVDRAALTHNDERAIIECIDVCYQQLEIGGKFIGIDWFSTDYPEFKKGNEAGDVWTKNNFKEGNFADVGKVHFSDKAHLLELFKKFKILNMTHRVSTEEIPNSYKGLAIWNFVAEKL